MLSAIPQKRRFLGGVPHWRKERLRRHDGSRFLRYCGGDAHRRCGAHLALETGRNPKQGEVVMQKMSGWAIAVTVMFLASLIGLVYGMCMLLFRPTGDSSLHYGGWLTAFSAVGIFAFGCVFECLTATEEEGRLPKPPPKTKNGSCGEDSGRHC